MFCGSAFNHVPGRRQVLLNPIQPYYAFEKIMELSLYPYQITVYGLLSDAVFVGVRFVQFRGSERVGYVQRGRVEPAVLVTGIRCGCPADVRRRQRRLRTVRRQTV